MTTHSKRLKMVHRIQDPTPSYTPSIMSSGSISSTGSRASSSKPLKNGYQHQTIPEDIALDNFSADNQSQILPKPTIKYSSGPCSSIISEKSGQSSIKTGSRLSIASVNRSITASRSLGGSKASLASNKSYKSSIQQEFHDIKVKRKVTSLSYGRAKRPFMYSIICFVLGGIGFFIGVCMLMFRMYGQLFLSMDKGEIIGPLFIVIGLILLSVGIKFMVDAYRFGAIERKRLGFRAAGPSMVTYKMAATDNPAAKGNDVLQSGSSGKQAIRKVLHPQPVTGFQSTSVLH